MVPVASETIKPRGIEVPLRQVLGCVAIAPARKESVATSTLGASAGLCTKTAWLLTSPRCCRPPGRARCSSSGMDTREGDGEVVGNALEVSMDAEFTVDLIREAEISWPRPETDEYIMTLGSARPLLQARSVR